MELEINESFAKHYNEYRSKEEAAKTKKKLKREIKEIEQSSSSSSDSDYDVNYQNKYVEHCDKLLREIENKGINALKEPQLWANEIDSRKTNDKDEKPLFAKDLNRKILLGGGIENEAELQEIEKILKVDSDDIINNCQKPADIIVDMENVSDDENFFKPSSNPSKFVIKNIEKENDDVESEVYSEDDNVDVCKSIEPGKIEINRDRKLKTVRISKTTTRAEKRQMKKERKEQELKEKMKRLQDMKTEGLLEKIKKIKKVVPQAAEHLILDELDEDFDIDEISKKLTDFFEKEDSSLPIDKEKPIFSDDSDLDIDNIDFEDIEYSENEEQPKNKKSSKTKNLEKPEETKKKKSSFFTNLEILENNVKKKKSGIVRKNNEIFNPEKYSSFSKYLKKNFDFCCEDLILGKDDSDDVLCKFKFREVEKQDYGLDTEEIILADPKELNKWASLKKITRIRTKVEEEKDRIRYEGMKEKKNEILKSIYCSESEENNSDCGEQKEGEEEMDQQDKSENNVLSKASRKRLRKNANKRKLKESLLEKDVDNLKSETEEPTKKKSKKNVEENIQDAKEQETQKNNEKMGKHDNAAKKKCKAEENMSENKEERKSDCSSIKVSKKKKQKINKGEDNEEVKLENGDSCKKHSNKSDDHKKHKKSKKGKSHTSVPVLSDTRLEAMGIKSGYYKHVLKKE